MSLYDTVRASVDKSGGEERVEVNQRALIDKILARYASAGAVYRELLQNSNDANATVAEIHFTTEEDPLANKNIVTSVQYKNNGMPFRPQDWARLKKIAEGNPDESKIGAFGVGAYTMFSICEEPIVLSGSQALAFVWKGDALWTKTIDTNKNEQDKKWTSFILPARDPYPLPKLEEFGEFLCAALTFTRSLAEIRVFVNDKKRMTIVKTQIQEPTTVQIQQNSSWWKSDGAITASPNGLFSLKDQDSLMESFYHVQVTLDDDTAAVTARYLSATAKTNIPINMVKRMERVTKKKPPSKVEVQIFLSGQEQFDNSNKKKSKAARIVQSFSPRIGEGRIFIGFRTSQTTGLAAHLAAPFVPTVEREAMDLQDHTLRVFNLDLLEFSGILMRLTLEHGMSALGLEYEKGKVERAKLDKKLIQEEEEMMRKKSKMKHKFKSKDDSGEEKSNKEKSSSSSSSSSNVWGFAKYMAKGVKKTIVKVKSKVEDIVDDGGELMHPRDPRPLCHEEHQAIVLMQSFCPRQSTPDPLVGTAIAQGFARCFTNKVPPVLTRSGVVPGDKARLPNKGMEAFCKEGVVRSIVYQNAEEYHNVIAQCRPLSLPDLSQKLSTDVLEIHQVIRFLKWWVRFTKSHNHITSIQGADIKEKIRFVLGTVGDNNNLPVLYLRDYLFYLDKDKIRTGRGYGIEDLPMPDSILPKKIRDEVTVRTLSDHSLNVWFSPLPVEIWVDFIAQHKCMTSGQPEDEKLRAHVLVTLSQEYTRRSISEEPIFGSFCQSVLREKRCIPFDSTEPTAYCADFPSNLYLYSAELKAFDGIGQFHKVSQHLKQLGISDSFLLALGVRKSVAIDFLFTNLDTLKWSNDPKPLVEYLRSATLTQQDLNKLKSTQYLPAENDVSRMFAPSELYLPDAELRIFPFVRMLQWPSGDALTERSLNGQFLTKLGINVRPPLLQLLRYISKEVNDNVVRLRCLEFVTKRLGPGGVYAAEYNQISKAERSNLKILPGVVTSPLDGESRSGVFSVSNCCYDAKCGVMGFAVIDPSLKGTAKVFGSLFQCRAEPDPGALIQQLRALVKSAKGSLNTLRGPAYEAFSTRTIKAFDAIFLYLSSRSSEMNPSLIAGLENEDFIPCLVTGKIKWFKPNEVFFKSEEEGGDKITELLFQVVDFSPFLAAVGVKQEAATRDIFRLMIESPTTFLSAVKSEASYKQFLRRVAAHRPFGRVTNEIRNSPFLLAYTVSREGVKEKTTFKLSKAEDIYIIDNSFFGRMFNVKRAPHESDLEDFYALIGSKYISKEVNKRYSITGDARRNTVLTKALKERIRERGPLLVSPSVTSRPLVANASSIISDTKLDIFEAPELQAVYTLKKAVRSQKITCCSQPGRFSKNSLYVTQDFDWFDVGYAIGELILERCQLEDAFFISSLLEAPLEQLRARGFPVDRIINPEAPPEAERPATNESTQTGREHGNHHGHTAATDKSNKYASKQKMTDPKSSEQSKEDDAITTETCVKVLKQMFPNADVNDIRRRLGENPSFEKVQALAEEMATEGDKKQEKRGDPQKPKVFGSKKLGRALNSLGGSIPKGLMKDAAGLMGGGGGAAPPSHNTGNDGRVKSPEADAMIHKNLEKQLERTVKGSSRVNRSGIQSEEKHIRIPEGLDHGNSCDILPGQDLVPFLNQATNKTETHNGIQIFSARKHPESATFLRDNADCFESFAVVLEQLSLVFGLSLKSVALYHDPTGKAIAFNSNAGALHFNVHYYNAIHFSKGDQGSACYSYWFVVFAHELAHNFVSAHNKDHGFYTEHYCMLYLPKLLGILSNME